MSGAAEGIMQDAVRMGEPPETTAAALPDAALTEAQVAEIRRLAERADALVEASLSANTRKAYGSAWRQWSEWCLGFGLDPQHADASWLAMHLTALSETRSLSTIELRRAAVLAIRRRLGRPLHLDDGYFPECKSAWGTGADRRRKCLISRDSEGSRSNAYTHTKGKPSSDPTSQRPSRNNGRSAIVIEVGAAAPPGVPQPRLGGILSGGM